MALVIVFLVLGLIIAISAIIFALQNPDIVTVTFLAWDFEQSLALVMLIAFVAGVVTLALVLLPGIIKRSRRIAVQNKRIKELAKTLPQDEQEAD